MADEVKRCEVCGESECWALADWSMGGAPGEYEQAMAKHYRLGYERERARVGTLEKANEMLEEDRKREKARADQQTLDWATTVNRVAQERDDLNVALAAARRECEGLKRVTGALIEKIYSVVRGPAIVDEVGRICRAALATPAEDT